MKQKNLQYNYEPSKNLLDTNENKLKKEENQEDFSNKFKIIRQNMSYVFLFLSLALIISVALVVLGILCNKDVSMTLKLSLLTHGFIMIGAILCGFFTFMYKIEDIKNTEIDISNIKNKNFVENNMFNILFYLLNIIIFITLFFFILIIFTKDTIKSSILGLSVNKANWINLFENNSYSYVKKKYINIYIASEILSIVLLILELIFAFLICKIGKINKLLSISKIIMFIIQFGLLLLLLYYSIFILELNKLSKIERVIPKFLPILLILISCISIIFYIFGYFSMIKENKSVYKIYIWFLVIFSIIFIFLFVYLFTLSIKFRNTYLDNNYDYSLTDEIHEKFLIDYIGCENKYVIITDYLEEMICPKYRISSYWEFNNNFTNNINLKKFGCINKHCNYLTYNYAKEHIDFVGLLCLIAFIISALKLALYYKKKKEIHIFFDIGRNKRIMYLVFVILLIYFALFIIFTIQIPFNIKKDSLIKYNVIDNYDNTIIPKSAILLQNPDNFIENKESSNTQLSELGKLDSAKDEMSEELDVKLEVKANTLIIENKYNCKNFCKSVKYIFFLSSEDGYFTKNFNLSKYKDVINIEIIKKDKDSKYLSVKISSDIYIQSFLDVIDYIPYCKLVKNFIKYKAYAVVTNQKNDNFKFTEEYLNNNLFTNIDNNFEDSQSLIQKKYKTNKKGKFKIYNYHTNNNILKLLQSKIENIQKNNLLYNENDNAIIDDLVDIDNNLLKNQIKAKVINFLNLKDNKVYLIHDIQKLEYSFISDKNLYVTGSLINKKLNYIKDSKFIIKPLGYDNCNNRVEIVNNGENFILRNFPILKNNGYIIYNLKISHSNYDNYFGKFITGGLSKSNVFLNNIVLFNYEILQTMKIIEKEFKQNALNSNIDDTKLNISEESTFESEKQEILRATPIPLKEENLSKAVENKDETKMLINTENKKVINEANNNNNNFFESISINRVNIESIIFNAENNMSVEGVLIEIYSGHKIFSQNILSNYVINYYNNKHINKNTLNYNIAESKDNNKYNNSYDNTIENKDKSTDKLKSNLNFLQFKLKQSNKIGIDNYSNISKENLYRPSLFINKTVSDENGKFIFRNLPQGEYTLLFKHNGFHSYSVKVTAIINEEDNIPTIGLSPILKDEYLRVVLSWGKKPLDLDLYSFVNLNNKNYCNTFFGFKECIGLGISRDSYSGGHNGVESITIKNLSDATYLFSVNNYIDKSDRRVKEEWDPELDLIEDIEKLTNKNNKSYSQNYINNNVELNKSNASISIYISYYDFPVYSISIPNAIQNINTVNNTTKNNYKDIKWWNIFCINGKMGINSLYVVNKFTENMPIDYYNICQIDKL